MSEKQTAGVQRRRSRAEVDRLVAEYEASGVIRQEFCAKHGLSMVTLDRHRRRRQQRPETPSRSSRFLRVDVSGAKPADGGVQELAVVLRSGWIEVRRGFDTELLAELVQMLERV